MRSGGARAQVDASRTVVLDEPSLLRGSDDCGLFGSVQPDLVLVDGNNLLWRAAHGHPAPFKGAGGADVTPVFRFFSMLRRAMGTWGVFAECIVCFDGQDAWRSRLEIDASYKSNRTYDDKDLAFMRWLPEIHCALSSAGVASVEIEDEEADDVIATFTARAGDRQVRILSTDRDYYQLLGPNVAVVNTRATPATMDAAGLISEFGVRADQWCDLRALAGDPSDGIPGVPGLGPKRAARLLADGAHLEDLDRLGRLDPEVRAAWEDVLRWRNLIRLRTDVQLEAGPTGQSTPALPGPVAVCRGLGLL